jgi:uridine phosphorylase
LGFEVTGTDDQTPPILSNKDCAAASAFTPESLLREARRQKSLSEVAVPKVCLLDPDGDIVRELQASGRARRYDGWACYHTDLFVADNAGLEMGVVGCAVGSSFAVLVAEELFASGCELLISVTSAGQIAEAQPPPYFILIERALRDEGTSYHYLPPSDWSEAGGDLLHRLNGAFEDLGSPVLRGSTWTTDAPFRETDAAISAMRERGVVAVEMEAAALYAFARARRRAVVCFAHVTNQMGRIDGDFEKGEANGSAAALRIVRKTAERLGARAFPSQRGG